MILSQFEMANTIRLCNPANFNKFLEYDGKKFTGILGVFVESLYQSIAKNSNISLEMRSQNDLFGEKIDKNNDQYSGCIGLLQANQSDVLVIFTDYPHPAVNISQGLVMNDEAISFINVYFADDHRDESIQIEHLFKSFSLYIWLLCVSTWLVSILVLLINRSICGMCFRMVATSSPTFPAKIIYNVSTHMTNRGDISNTSGPVRIIMYLTLSVFSFLVIFHLCSFIKTELVVISPPSTVRTYHEMLTSECGVFFLSGNYYYHSFKFAPETSIEKRLWDFSISKYSTNNVLFTPTEDPRSFQKVAKLMFKRKLALIFGSDATPAYMRAFCTLSFNKSKRDLVLNMLNISLENESMRPLASQDEQAHTSMKGVIATALPSAPLQRMKVSFRRAFEAALPDKIMQLIGQTDSLSWLGSTDRAEASPGDMDQCINSIVSVPEAHVENVELKNFRNFPLFALYLVTFQLFVLFMEIVTARVHKV